MERRHVTPVIRRAGLLAVVVLSSGCHTYAQIDRASVTPGQNIRVEIERQEAVRQVETLGSLDTSIQGTVQELSAGSIGLTIRDPNTIAGSPGFNTFISFPWDQVVRVEEKRFSLVKTGAMAAIGAVVTVAILNIADNSSSDPDGGGGTDAQRVTIPIFSIGR